MLREFFYLSSYRIFFLLMGWSRSDSDFKVWEGLGQVSVDELSGSPLLGALRLIRRIIGLKDDTYVRHICDKGILDQVVDAFVANGTRYNLLNSSLIELFEYIKNERIHPLIDVSTCAFTYYFSFSGNFFSQNKVFQWLFLVLKDNLTTILVSMR